MLKMYVHMHIPKKATLITSTGSRFSASTLHRQNNLKIDRTNRIDESKYERHSYAAPSNTVSIKTEYVSYKIYKRNFIISCISIIP